MRNLKQTHVDPREEIIRAGGERRCSRLRGGPGLQTTCRSRRRMQFVSTDQREQFATADVEADFWKAFGDEQLNTLIEQALKANHDIRIATAGLREARALRGEVASGFRTDGDCSRWSHRIARQRTAGAAAPGSSATRITTTRASTRSGSSISSVASGAASKPVRRLVQAAEAGVYSTQVSITAEVARNYFELRGSQQRSAVAQRNAENQRETLRITTARLDAGRGTQLDTSRAQAQLSATLATIPDFESCRHSQHPALGRADRSVARVADRRNCRAVQKLPALPATSEHRHAGSCCCVVVPTFASRNVSSPSATAQIGVAVGDLFPRISFVGTLGFRCRRQRRPRQRSSEAYSFGPSIQWAAFDLGRVRQRIKQREAATDRALARYEQTVLQALEETDASMTDYAKAQGQASALARQHHRFAGGCDAGAGALRKRRRRLPHRARCGTQRALTAEDQLALSETQTATALLATYKALGGGFRPLNAQAAL